MATLEMDNNSFYQHNHNPSQFDYQPYQNQSFQQNQINNANLRYQYQQNQIQTERQNMKYFNQTNYTKNHQNYPNNNNKAFINMQPQNNLLTRHNSSQTPLVSQAFINQQNLQKLPQNQQIQQKMKIQGQKRLPKQKMNPNQSRQLRSKKNSKNARPMNKSKQKQNHPIEKGKNLQKREMRPKLKPSYSQQIIRQKPSVKNEITEQQIALAQIASLQNIKNPNNSNVSTVSLTQRFLDKEGNEETQSQYEKEDEVRENEQQKKEMQQQQQKQETEINETNEADVFENLYRTETGLIIFRNGLLRGIIHKFAEITDVVSKIQIMLTAGVKFNLLYRASDHGDKAKIFHQKCDNHQMTLVLVETTKGRRFGGFTTKTWNGNCLKKIDNDAFVFSLDKHKIYDVHKNEFAVGGYPKFGPVFFGCQIRIYDEFFTKGGTTCHRALNYKTKEEFELNHGEQTYIVKEIEVYDIEVIKIT
jgi:hypothetical protein